MPRFDPVQQKTALLVICSPVLDHPQIPSSPEPLSFEVAFTKSRQDSRNYITFWSASMREFRPVDYLRCGEPWISARSRCGRWEDYEVDGGYYTKDS